jgi:hypothetical protein
MFAKALPLLMLISAIALAASEDRSVFGTHWVQFQPIQVGGTLKGCQLVYMTVAADRVYQNGDWIAVNGSIVVRDLGGGPTNIALTLKVGLRNLSRPTTSEFVRPHFAYLQTAHSSTAKAPQKSADGDSGYKLFFYRSAEPAVAEVLKDIADSPKLTIGYNRQANGSDVLAPLDLTIVESTYTDANEVIRKSSPDVMNNWAKCMSDVLTAVLAEKK